nr:hypothetical protein [Tanacetum cinerariifolium]
MSSLFADTHNVVAILEKSDAAEGFEQIIYFLRRNYIHHVLTVNPHIYISCIKQFWNTASVKRSADITRLQADKKKIVISEVVIREILQWKFLIHTILQSLSAKRTSWNEFSTTMASAVIFLSKGVETPLFEGMLVARPLAEEGIAEEQVQADDVVVAAVEENVAEDVVHDAIPSPPSHDIPSPSQEPSSHPQQPQSSPQASPQGADFPTHIQQVLDVCSALTKRVENLKNDNAAQKLEIIKLQARVKRLEKTNKVKSSKSKRLRKVRASKQVESSDDMEDVFNQGRMINDMDKDEGIELVKDADIAETEGRHAAEQAKKQAEIYNLDLDHSSKVLIITASATISAAKPSIPAPAPTVVAAYTRRRKGVIIRDPEEELSSKTPAETPKLKDKGKGILVETPKPMKKKDQIELDAEYARKLHEEINRDHEEKKRPQTESEARKNMMIYLKNTAGYKMDFFKGMTYAQICPIFQARFDENMRFLFKSREEMEEEDKELLELMLSKRSRKNTKCVNAANEELTAAKHKLMMLKLKLFKNIAVAEEITK